MSKHRAPPRRTTVPLIAGGALIGVVCSVVALAQNVAPRVQASATSVPRVDEPTGRGGPIAPIFEPRPAPHYPVGDGPQTAPTVHTPQRQETTEPQRPVIATSVPVSAATPPPGLPVTAEPEPAPSVPAEPAPVVGLPPVVETSEPPVIEETPVPEPETPPVVEEPAVEDVETAPTGAEPRTDAAVVR